MPSLKTVGDALAHATAYWEANEVTHSRRGCNMMPIRAAKCASFLGHSRRLNNLTASDGASLLVKLREGGLSRASVKSYYAAGRRMIELAGVSTVAWPKAPTPPRKTREPIDDRSINELHEWLIGKGWGDTAELLQLMRQTGLRVEVEALNGDFEVSRGALHVVSGKGGHSRVIPYRGTATGPLRANGGITYEGHLRRWRAGVRELGLRADFRPHDLRRHFIKGVYDRSGKDLRVAQILAGHSDPGTTAGYIGVDWDELQAAVA